MTQAALPLDTITCISTTSTVVIPPWAISAPPMSNGALLQLPSPPNETLHQTGSTPLPPAVHGGRVLMRARGYGLSNVRWAHGWAAYQSAGHEESACIHELESAGLKLAQGWPVARARCRGVAERDTERDNLLPPGFRRALVGALVAHP